MLAFSGNCCVEQHSIGLPLSGEFLVSDDANSDFGLLGANPINKHLLYATGGGLDPEQDMLAYCYGTSTKFGRGCQGSNGLTPDLSIDGCMSPVGTFTISMTGGIAGSVAVLAFGEAQAGLPLGYGCNVLITPITSTFAYPLVSDPTLGGTLAINLTAPSQVLPFQLRAQAAAIDVAHPLGMSLSNGVLVEVE